MALISHELRAPLTSTLLWARMLKSEDTGPYGRVVAATAIERSVEAQTKLVDEMLELACIATARLRLDPKSVEPATLIRAAVLEQRLLAEQRSIRVETTVDESIEQLVVDPVRIVQAISRLLARAIHFTPIGGRVGLCLERASGSARIRVIDYGTGISPELLPHVFERFRRRTVTPHPCLRGAGVGLAACQEAGRAARRSRVRGEPGRGEWLDVHGRAPAAARGAAILAASARLLTGIRVLVVDEDENVRDAAHEVLERQGAEVTAVDRPRPRSTRSGSGRSTRSSAISPARRQRPQSHA